MATIDILMAVYNGEAYIRQQIFSIMSQDYQDWRLIIHDDGSTDKTRSIIARFVQMDSRILWVDDGITFHNPAKNFMHLLKSSTADFVCFCDQDDIWLENKLSSMLTAFPDTEKPGALFSSGYIYDSANNRILSELNYRINNLKELLYVNGGIHGCRSMFNHVMREYLLRYSGEIDMHDHLMSLIACSFGRIEYIDVPLLLYRQHGSNVSGNITISPMRRLLMAFSNIRDKFLVNRVVYQTIADFYSVYRQELSEADAKLIGIYLDPRNKNWLFRTYHIVRNGFSLCERSKFRLFAKSLTRKYSN